MDSARGKALADEYGIKFLETSAKNSINVEEAFITLAKDIKKRIIDNSPEPTGKTDNGVIPQGNLAQKQGQKPGGNKSCCG